MLAPLSLNEDNENNNSLVLLFEYLAANFPNHFSILLGLVFIVIVYFIPQGLSGVLARLLGRNAASKGEQP